MQTRSIQRFLPLCTAVCVPAFLVVAVLWKGGKSLESTWLLVGLAGLCTLSWWWQQPKQRVSVPMPIWGIAIAFFLWTVLSYMSTMAATYGFDEVLRTGSLVIMFFWAARTAERKQAIGLTLAEIILLWLAYATILACLFGVAVYVFQPVERFVGTFFDHRFHTDYWPNAWAQYLLLTWPVVWWWTQRLGKQWSLSKQWLRVLRTVVVGFVFGCLFLSYSRGAGIAFCGQLGLLLGYTLQRKAWRKHTVKLAVRLLVAGLVGVLVFGAVNRVRDNYYSVQSVEDKVTFTAAEGTSSISERKQFWRQSLTLITKHPIVGWGPYSFRFVQPQLQSAVLATSDHPHNIFLKFAVERGVPAVILFLSLLSLVLVPACQRLLQNKTFSPDKPTLWLLVAVAGVLAHNLIDYNVQFVGIALPFWLLLGLLLAPTLKVEKRPLVRRLILKFEVTIVGLLLLVTFVEGIHLVTSSFGRHAERRQQYTLAMAWYDRAEHQKFSRDMHLSRTNMALLEDDSETAQAAAKRYINLSPYDYRGWLLLGSVCFADGDLECAKERFEQAYVLGRYNDSGIMRSLMQTYLALNDRESLAERKREFAQLIDAYADAIERNAHFIALSQNVEHIQVLSDMFIVLYPDEEPKYAVLGAAVTRKGEEERERLNARPPGYLW